MGIIDSIDSYISMFTRRIMEGEGRIARGEIYQQFTSMFPTFGNPIFDKEQFESYLIEQVQFYSQVKVVDE